MKRGIFLLPLVYLLTVSCSVDELDIQDTNASSQDVFHAYLESYSEPDTKVYVNEDIRLRWDAEDRISIFKTTYNSQYRFEGVTGDADGDFSEVPSGSFVTGNELEGFICAVYPYQRSTTISNSNVLSFQFPAEQTYRKGSFGPGANTMVSVTKTKTDPLKFKNAGGYLVLKFYGKDISVSSITLEGRNGEFLSGKGAWEIVLGATPDFTFDSTAGTSITLTCKDPVALGATKEEATAFWIVVPPTPFEKGIKLTITRADGKEATLETDMKLSIVRNTLLRITPVELHFD